MMYTPSMGLLWTVIMFVGYSLTFLIGENAKNLTNDSYFKKNPSPDFGPFLGGFLLAKPMRAANCVTMMDPFQAKYNKVVTVALSLTSLMVEIICLPTTMLALGVCLIRQLPLASVSSQVGETLSFFLSLAGGTMSVVLDLPFAICIWISTSVAVVYTLLGGLYSVAYTDVIQLLLMFISLVSHSGHSCVCHRTTRDLLNV